MAIKVDKSNDKSNAPHFQISIFKKISKFNYLETFRTKMIFLHAHSQDVSFTYVKFHFH